MAIKVASVKHLPAMQETWVQFLDQEVPLEKEMATHSSILAWRIQWTVFQIPAPGTFASLFCNSAQKIGNMSRSLKVSQKSSGKAAVEPWEVQGFSKSSGAQALLECVCITC